MKGRLVLVLMMCSLMCACGKEKVDDTQIQTTQKVEESNIGSDENKTIIGIELNTDELKKEYLRNEAFEDSKVLVSAVYSDGSTEALRRGELSVSEVDTATCGTKEVVVTYLDHTTTFTIVVNYNIINMEPSTKYTNSKLNLRNGPGLEFDAVKSLPAGTALEATGVADNNWYRVVYNKQEYYCSNKFLTDTKPVAPSTSKYIGNTLIVKEDGADQAAVDKAVELYGKLPDKVKNLLKNNLWEICVSSTDLTLKFNYSTKIAGVTTGYLTSEGEFQYGSGTVYLSDNVAELEKAFYYEIGHAVDYSYGLISESEEFKTASAAERDLLNIDDAPNMKYKTSQTEYFALIFREMMENSSIVKEQAPSSYNFIHGYLY